MKDVIDVDALLDEAYSKKDESKSRSDGEKKRSHKKRSRSRTRSRTPEKRRHKHKSSEKYKEKYKENSSDSQKDHSPVRPQERSTERYRDRGRDKYRERSYERDQGKSRYNDRERTENYEKRRDDRDVRRRNSREKEYDRSTNKDRQVSPPKSTAYVPNRVPANEMEPLTVEERDARTIFMRQLARSARDRDIEEFFRPIGKIRDIRMIMDRNSKRPKGMCYVEFQNIESVGFAIRKSNEFLCGAPVIIQATMAEKNRAAMEAAALAKQYGPTKLYVGGLHPDMTESMLRAIFEPFGAVDTIQLQYDTATGLSKGFGFVHFKESENARHAAEKLNGFELGGKTMKVCHVNEKADFNFIVPDDYTRRSTDLASSNTPAALTYPSTALRSEPPSCCMVISNAFDSFIERAPGWAKDLEKEIRGSITEIGTLRHFFIDKNSVEGNVYMRFHRAEEALLAVAKLKGRIFSGRMVRTSMFSQATYQIMFPNS